MRLSESCYCLERRPTVDKKLETRCKIGAVFEHYAQQSEYYRHANVAQRIVMEDRFYWLTMKLLSKIIGPFEGMEPGKD